MNTHLCFQFGHNIRSSLNVAAFVEDLPVEFCFGVLCSRFCPLLYARAYALSLLLFWALLLCFVADIKFGGRSWLLFICAGSIFEKVDDFDDILNLSSPLLRCRHAGVDEVVELCFEEANLLLLGG